MHNWGAALGKITRRKRGELISQIYRPASTLHGVVQEALTNVSKDAPHPSRRTIERAAAMSEANQPTRPTRFACVVVRRR